MVNWLLLLLLLIILLFIFWCIIWTSTIKSTPLWKWETNSLWITWKNGGNWRKALGLFSLFYVLLNYCFCGLTLKKTDFIWRNSEHSDFIFIYLFWDFFFWVGFGKGRFYLLIYLKWYLKNILVFTIWSFLLIARCWQ